MSGPDCPECGMHFLECHCNKKKKRKKPTAAKQAEPSYMVRYGGLHAIPNEDLYKFLEENETRDAAFLAIVCSEILRRRHVQKSAAQKFIDNPEKSAYKSTHHEFW